MSIKWIVASVTQGSNDAFVEGTISTGLSNVNRTAWRIRRVHWLLPALPGVDSNVQAVLRRNSAASILADAGMITGCYRANEFTTSGLNYQSTFPNEEQFERDEDLTIVEETIYLNLDTNGTSATNSLTVRIAVEQRSITETERLTIQASY